MERRASSLSQNNAGNVAELQERIDGLEAALQERDDENEALRADFIAREAKLREVLDAAEKVIGELRLDKGQVDDLEMELEMAQAANAKLKETSQKTIDELEEDLKQRESTITELEEELRVATAGGVSANVAG